MKSLDLTIGQRLAIGFGLLLLTFVVFAAAVSVWNTRSDRAQMAFVSRIDPLSRRADGLERALLYVGISVRALLLNPGPEALERFRGAVEQSRVTLDLLSQIPKDRESEALYRRAAALIEPYLQVASAIADERANGPVREESELQLATTREQALRSVRQFVELQRRRTEAALAAMAAARDKVTAGISAAALLAILMSLSVAYFTTASIRQPTRRLLAVAASMERGDWHPALSLAPDTANGQGATLPSNSEMSRLARALGSAAVSLERRERRLHAKREVAHATASTLQREPLAAAALAAILDYVRAEVGAVFSFDPRTETLHPLATHALPVAPAPVRLGEGIPGQAAKQRGVVVARDIPRDSEFAVKLGYDRAPPRTVIAVPIVFGDQLHGVLLAASLRNLDEDASSFLASAASQLGVGLQNVFAFEEIQRLLAEMNQKNQQIQAQNEELQAQSEELQAQNEEIQAQSEELQAQNEEIQGQNEELKRQGDELRRQAQALAEADERKNHFLGVLAHELRNPMAPITNSLVILKRTPPGSEQALKAQAVIERQARHLNRLIDDLLDITRISQGKIRIHSEHCDFAEIVRACVEDQRSTLESQEIRLDMSLPRSPVPVHGDPTRLSQVIGNLLSNAIKFTDRGGRIGLDLHVDQSARQLVLGMSDDGIGIDASLVPRLFQPFSQGTHDHVRTSGGLGLGLALVKALVTLHGGTVQVHSEGVGKGSEFTVTLPLSQDELDVAV